MARKAKKEEKNEITVEYLITREFHSSQDFSIHIETEAQRRGIRCMEVLMEYCEGKDIEPSSVASFVTGSLKQKIQTESENLNLLKKQTGTLPL
jgi:hypothetical protein